MSLSGTVKKTSRKVARALSPSPDEQGDMDILDKLKQEHREVEGMLDDLVDSDSAAERKTLLKKIKTALVPHVRAEEKVVYDPVIALKDKDAKQDGEEGYLEHGLADRMLLTLGKISNANSPEFSAAAKVLRELVKHHVQEEENNVWSDVKDHFSEEERIQMNRKFEAAKKKVKIPA
jgi:hemerythrin superfamily protein